MTLVEKIKINIYIFEVDTIVDEENTVISFLLGEFKKIKSTVLVVHI